MKVKDLFVILRLEGLEFRANQSNSRKRSCVHFVLNCQEVAQIRRLVEL